MHISESLVDELHSENSVVVQVASSVAVTFVQHFEIARVERRVIRVCEADPDFFLPVLNYF